jgi:hypothetical protein
MPEQTGIQISTRAAYRCLAPFPLLFVVLTIDRLNRKGMGSAEKDDCSKLTESPVSSSRCLLEKWHAAAAGSKSTEGHNLLTIDSNRKHDQSATCGCRIDFPATEHCDLGEVASESQEGL